MIYLRWLVLAVLDILLLVTVPFAAPLIAAFTREQPYGQAPYTWGGLWGTYDNPPQGDRGFVRERCLFPGAVTGLRGYLNRIHWMVRNNLYGYARKCAIQWVDGCRVQHVGNENISDKYRIPGWYFAIATAPNWRLIGFEFYGVFPWLRDPVEVRLLKWTLFTIQPKDLRMRLGWKIMTDKFKATGFAPLVNTGNPFDGYGEN